MIRIIAFLRLSAAVFAQEPFGFAPPRGEAPPPNLSFERILVGNSLLTFGLRDP